MKLLITTLKFLLLRWWINALCLYSPTHFIRGSLLRIYVVLDVIIFYTSIHPPKAFASQNFRVRTSGLIRLATMN